MSPREPVAQPLEREAGEECARCDVCRDVDVVRYAVEQRGAAPFCGRCGRQIPVVLVTVAPEHR